MDEELYEDTNFLKHQPDAKIHGEVLTGSHSENTACQTKDHSLQYTVSSTEVLGYQEDSETGQAVTPHSPPSHYKYTCSLSSGNSGKP